MERTKRIAEMEALLAKGKLLCEQHNNLVNGDEVEIPEGETAATLLAKNEDETDKVINEYTGHAKALCYEDCRATGDPMTEACRRVFYQSYRIADSETEDGTKIRDLEPQNKRINLKDLHNRTDGGIGKDKQWINIGEKLNMLMTVRAIERLKGKVDLKEFNDSYYISDIAKAIDLGKTPCSNTNILKTLRAAISAMIGEEYAPKVNSHHVNEMCDTYIKKDNKVALRRKASNHDAFRVTLMEICHSVITDGEFEVTYKQKTKKA